MNVRYQVFLPKKVTSKLFAKASPPPIAKKTHFVDATLKKIKVEYLAILNEAE